MILRRNFLRSLGIGVALAPVAAASAVTSEAPSTPEQRTVLINGYTVSPEDFKYLGNGYFTFDFKLRGTLRPDIMSVPFVKNGHVRQATHIVTQDLPPNTPIRIFDPATMPPGY
jgi:hypothetical protein